MNIVFPWPPKELSPNARVHWAVKAKVAHKYKIDCGWVCFIERPRSLTNEVKITFLPPSKRRADLDNMLASFKYGLDAIANYLNVDDSSFQITLAKGSPTKNGAVEVEIT